MNSDITLHQFEGWAIVEMMGHAREAGYVTTEYFGTANAMFAIKVPGLPEINRILESEEYHGGIRRDAGTTVIKPEVKPRERLVGAGAVYAINPATQEEVLAEVESTRTSTRKWPGGTDINPDDIPF